MDHALMPATRALLADLVAFPTVSADSNLGLIAWADARLGEIGARTRTTLSPCGTKANLFATLGPEVDGGTVLSGHTDVVPVEGQGWTLPPFETTRTAGRIHGRGTCDMKGFLACALAVAPQAAATALARPLHIAMTYDEEVGCLGAPALLDALDQAGIRPATCIVGEPTEMRAIEGHKGMCEYTTRFRGLAGHGSDPDAGVSAVEYAVRYAARLLALRERLRERAPRDSRFRPPHSTLQVGRLSGGSGHNVIAEEAELAWELRPVTPEDRGFVTDAMRRYAEDELLPAMRRVHAGAAIETEVIGEVAGLDPLPDNAARDLVQALTGGNGADVVAFGTEAGLFQQRGIATVVCGPGSIAQAHRADEYVEETQLARCLAMLEGLIPRLAA